MQPGRSYGNGSNTHPYGVTEISLFFYRIMQVFVTSTSCIETASQLDRKRLNKQIIEAGQILKAIKGEGKGWHHHPATLMYARHAAWLDLYRLCLQAYFSGDMETARAYSIQADALCPPFITDKLCEQHRKRLFTKAPDLYPEFSSYGTSQENWYVVDGKLLKYVGGKLIKQPMDSQKNH